MLGEKMEQTTQLLQGKRREVTTPINEPVLNKGQSEKGSYSRIVDTAEPQRVSVTPVSQVLFVYVYKYKIPANMVLPSAQVVFYVGCRKETRYGHLEPYAKHILVYSTCMCVDLKP